MQLYLNGKAFNPSTATLEELKAFAAQEAAKERKPGNAPSITFRVGEKGGVSAYGLGRFPVTLYESQWDRLIQVIPQLQEFMEANKALLKQKPE